MATGPALASILRDASLRDAPQDEAEPSTRLEIPERRRRHFKTVADGGAGIAAETRDGVELCRIDAHALDVDDVALVMRVDDFTEDDLARLAEFKGDVAAAL